jgi:hypothetical protein
MKIKIKITDVKISITLSPIGTGLFSQKKFFVTYYWVKLGRVFVPGKPFEHRVMSACKAGAFPSGVPSLIAKAGKAYREQTVA